MATQETIGVAPVPQLLPLVPPLATTGSRGSIAALPPSNQTLYYARGDNTWQILPTTTYVVGPANSVSGDLATYADTTGRLLGGVSRLDAVPAGSVVQVAYGEYTANVNLTTVIPYDDTVPQNTEGTEILSVSITPRFVNSKVLVSYRGLASGNVAINAAAALFGTWSRTHLPHVIPLSPPLIIGQSKP